MWENRIVKYGEVDPSDLLANEYNWRIHPMEQQEAIEDSLEQVGWVQDVIVNLRSSDEWGKDKGVETLVDGHARVKIALRNGGSTIPVKYVDLTPIEEYQVLASLDRITGMATQDDSMLLDIVNKVMEEDRNVPGMTDAEIEQLMEKIGKCSVELMVENPGRLMVCPNCQYQFRGVL